MPNLDLATAIERHLEEQADLHIAVRVGEEEVILAGRVSTPEARQGRRGSGCPSRAPAKDRQPHRSRNLPV
jgi:hypothetical protein